MGKKINIGEKAKVCIKWNVMPVDFSHEKEKEIISKFAKKYGISKDNVKVEPIFIQKNINGETVTLADGIIDDVNDPKFLQELFKTYFELNDIDQEYFSPVIDIDSMINLRINYEAYDKHKRYALKWIKWSNFMSYGKDNYFDFRNLKGLVLLKSDPANQGGKTTFCIDLFRFLLFGKVTSRENDWTLSKAFNCHLPEETECSVEGCVQIDGIDYVIRRVLTRPKLEKRTERSKVTQKVNYYKLVNDEYIDIEDEENQNESNGRDTNKAIKDAIGNENDFDLMICVNSDNLKDLISFKDTERGRLISRWIGLLPLEEKDKLSREVFNQEISPKFLSNKYVKEDLKTKIDELKKENEIHEKNKVKNKEKEGESVKRIDDLKKTRDTLLQSKSQIDNSLINVDVTTVEARLNDVTEKGKIKRTEKESNEAKLKELGDIQFDENDYKDLEDECTALSVEIATMRERVKSLNKDIDALEKGEFCPTCGAKLKNVDNSKAIEDKKNELAKLVEYGKVKAASLKEKTEKKEKLSVKRTEYNNKLRLQLTVEKNGVDIENLIALYKEIKRLLKDIEDNKSAIENNNRIQLSLNNIDINIRTEESTLKMIQNNIIEENNSITYNNRIINESEEIIKVLNKEEKEIKAWKIYLEMVGKHGVSKLIIRKALPFINGELQRLLNGVCDFTVEISIDDKNDVGFYLIHDNVRSSLGSGSGLEKTIASLALRSVLSKVSTFSKPSFVVFDEILGGVANDNYEYIKLLYDKIISDYSMVIEICHIPDLADMHDMVIKVTKENNISRIEAA